MSKKPFEKSQRRSFYQIWGDFFLFFLSFFFFFFLLETVDNFAAINNLVESRSIAY